MKKIARTTLSLIIMVISLITGLGVFTTDNIAGNGQDTSFGSKLILFCIFFGIFGATLYLELKARAKDKND